MRKGAGVMILETGVVSGRSSARTCVTRSPVVNMPISASPWQMQSEEIDLSRIRRAAWQTGVSGVAVTGLRAMKLSTDVVARSLARVLRAPCERSKKRCAGA